MGSGKRHRSSKTILLSLSILFEQNKGKERNISRKILLNKCQRALSSKYGVEALGGGGGVLPSYSGLYWEAPPERGVFFKLTVCKRVGKIAILVYERVTKSAAKWTKGWLKRSISKGTTFWQK